MPLKTEEILEIETAAMTVLVANPTTPTYSAYRELLAAHLSGVYHYDVRRVEQALLDLDRGEVELPKRLPFTRAT